MCARFRRNLAGSIFEGMGAALARDRPKAHTHSARARNYFAKRHREYLATASWAAKRTKVLRRAESICEGCLNTKATVVHHLATSDGETNRCSIVWPCVVLVTTIAALRSRTVIRRFTVAAMSIGTTTQCGAGSLMYWPQLHSPQMASRAPALAPRWASDARRLQWPSPCSVTASRPCSPTPKRPCRSPICAPVASLEQVRGGRMADDVRTDPLVA